MSEVLCVNRFDRNSHGGSCTKVATVHRTYMGQRFDYCAFCARLTAGFDWSRAAEFVLEVSDGEYTDRGLQTASWYDVHKLTPGTYPLIAVQINHHPLCPGQAPYYYRAVVASTLITEYRVNTLWTASSSSTTHPNQASTVHVGRYAYEVREGLTMLDGLAVVRPVPVAAEV